MAAEIESALGVKPVLKGGRTGSFEIVADNRPIFSKLQSGRFPDNSEVVRKLRELGE
ncbi:MAG: Rdx family protein [Acidobacteria bacterium]|nr:Rdx family protein [Acidobacteriota bacterium]